MGADMDDTKPLCVWLMDSTGREWVSDPDTDAKLTPYVMEQATEVMSKLREVSDFRLTVAGRDVHFHPDHIVAWGFRPAEVQ